MEIIFNKKNIARLNIYILYGLLTKRAEVKMAGIGQVLFLRVYVPRRRDAQSVPLVSFRSLFCSFRLVISALA